MVSLHRGYRRLITAALVAALAAAAIAGCEDSLGLGDDYSQATCGDIGDSDYREDMAGYIAGRVLPASRAPREEVEGRVNGRLELACASASDDEQPFEAVVAESLGEPRQPARASAPPARRPRPARDTAARRAPKRPAPAAKRPQVVPKPAPVARRRPRPRAKPAAGRSPEPVAVQKVSR